MLLRTPFGRPSTQHCFAEFSTGNSDDTRRIDETRRIDDARRIYDTRRIDDTRHTEELFEVRMNL